MTSIDPAKAVDVVALLENALRGADPDFTTPAKPAGIKASLGALAITREHRQAGMMVGQNVDALVSLARRQLFEFATTIRNIILTMPTADMNAAAINALIAQLSK